MNEMDEEDEEQYYDDAMFEEEGPTAVELAQRIIKELESNQTISLDELKEKIEVFIYMCVYVCVCVYLQLYYKLKLNVLLFISFILLI